MMMIYGVYYSHSYSSGMYYSHGPGCLCYACQSLVCQDYLRELLRKRYPEKQLVRPPEPEIIPEPEPEPDPAEERLAELLKAEEELIRSLGEAGYDSPYWIGDRHTASGENYWRWREHRNDYVATGSQQDYDLMLSRVTYTSPPLASDIRRQEEKLAALSAWWADSWRFLLLAVFVTLLVVFVF